MRIRSIFILSGNKSLFVCVLWSATHASIMIVFYWEKSNFHPRTIAKVWFSTFNYEIGQHSPFNYQNQANQTFAIVGGCKPDFSLKINMSIYSIYDHILNAYTIIYCLVYTLRTYFSLGQIHHTSWDIHVGVATSECRNDFSYIYIYVCVCRLYRCHRSKGECFNKDRIQWS